MIKRYLWISLRFALIIGIFIYLYKTNQLDFSKLKKVQSNIALFVAAFSLIFLAGLITVQRWRILVHAQNIYLGLWPAIKLTFIGYFFGAALPGAVSGDIVKAYYFSKGEQQKAMLITTIVFDRLLGLYTLIFAAVLTILISIFYFMMTGQYSVYSQGYVRSLGIFVGVLFFFCTLMGVLFMSKTLRKSHMMERILLKLPFHQTIIKVYDTFQRVGEKPGFIFNAFVLSLIAQLFAYAGFFCLALILEIKMIAPINYLFILPVCMLINAIPLAPGGLGVGEAGFRAVFLLFGSNEGAELAVLFHAIFFILAIGFGGLVYLFSDLSKDR
jgi:hypothetical protein